ncbi:MAG: virulence protein RhuM/Fic/DOC family protein [Candidatus Amesbacteria bacterium]|nr:virulence protein RhuM/Fic/DOC family protein [Candidatus Amesbacteria bacterium]
MKRVVQNNVVIYQTKSGAIELKGDFTHNTIWADLQQISVLFNTDKSGISRHIQNIYKTKELDMVSTVAKNATVQTEGKRNITREITYYNLDLILSVGYRVNSKQATLFRQWATNVLREHITKGYTINKNYIAKNYLMFLKAVDEVKSLLPSGNVVDAAGVLELVKMFASTWLSLDAYDKSKLPISGVTKKQVIFSARELKSALSQLKSEIDSDIFGVERISGAVDGIVGNVFQSFANQDVYPNIEEKAAHLLYFMVKDHPYMDGNKRSGAFAFIWFLKKAKILDTSRITPEALTALTLLVAESEPKNKDRIISIILQLLSK